MPSPARLIDDTLLARLAELGVWKFQFFDPLEWQYPSNVIGVQGAFELDRFMALLEKHPHHDTRLATEILGIVAGEGGSGWKRCTFGDAQRLRALFVARYGEVHEIPDYPPLAEA